MTFLDGMSHSQVLALSLALVGITTWLFALFVAHRRNCVGAFPIVAFLVFVSAAPLITLIGAGAFASPVTVQDVQIFARSWLIGSGLAYLAMLRRSRGWS